MFSTATYDPTTLPFYNPAKTNKVALVTGANAGIGYYTVLHLYIHGFHVYMACRNQAKAEEAKAKLEVEAKERLATDPKLKEAFLGKLTLLKIDLCSLKQTEEAAEIFKRQEPKGLDVLVNNAGVMAVPFELTEDGYDVQLQVNHVAPTLFTLKLLPLLLAKGGPARVVNLSSIGHTLADGTCDYTKTLDHWPLFYWGFVRYGQAKTASIQFAKALASRFPTKLFSCSVHPGFCLDTNLAWYWRGRGIGAMISEFVIWVSTKVQGIPTEEGCYTSIYAALSEDLTPQKDNGNYYCPMPPHPEATAATASSPELIEKTWKWTIDELKAKGFLDAAEIASFIE